MSEPQVFSYDSLDHRYFTPMITDRLLHFAQEFFNEGDPALHIRQMMGRILLKDSNIMLLMGVDPDSGAIVGHALATIDGHGSRAWVYVWQCQVDPKQPTLGRYFIQALDEWGLSKGAERMIMATGKSERAMQRKYGFTTRYAVMERLLKAGELSEQGEQVSDD